MAAGERDLVLGTAGHIDHGKTALVRALTGVDTDRLPAEKHRGITIDLGFAALDLGRIRLALVDVPGHERFIRNMLAGASGLDLAMLVVAADDSVMPQTREHLEILRLLGLSGRRGRPDQVRPGRRRPGSTWSRRRSASWSRARSSNGAPIVRTSATTGPGIDDAEGRAWRGSARAVADRARLRACSGWRSTGRSPSPGTGRSSPARSPRGRSPSATTWSGSPTAGPSGSAACTGTTGRSSGSAAAPGRRSTWRASTTRRSAAGRSWPRRATWRRPGSCRSRSATRPTGPAAAAAPGPVPAPPGDGRGLGHARPARGQRAGRRRGPAGPALPGRAGGRRLRPAVRAPRGEPAGDARRRAGCSSPSARADPPPRPRRDRPAGPAAVARPGRAAAPRRWRSWGSTLDRARALRRGPGCRSTRSRRPSTG